MSQSPLQAIHEQINNIPPLPATVGNVLRVTSNPESSAKDLMEVVLPDQTMCAAILKLANSAAFGQPKQVHTIERALMVLGFDEIKHIIIGTAVFSSFPKLNHETAHNIGIFWEHAFTCGLTAKIIGEHYNLSASELFISGLIHDIGKLVMFMAFPASYPILHEHSLASHFQAMGSELIEYGTGHDDVGLELATRWALPYQLCCAIGYHHRPEQAPSHTQHPLIVQVADILSLMYCCSDIHDPKDVENIFYDFLPDTYSIWKKNGLPLSPENLGDWFITLQENRENDPQLLSSLGV